jgi:hypothetical protein
MRGGRGLEDEKTILTFRKIAPAGDAGRGGQRRMAKGCERPHVRIKMGM